MPPVYGGRGEKRRRSYLDNLGKNLLVPGQGDGHRTRGFQKERTRQHFREQVAFELAPKENYLDLQGWEGF